MNVFVLCTGRTGSSTFIEACKHVENYSSAHESRSSRCGSARLDFPACHIEADNRLIWFFGDLDKKYGKEPFYVHLRRNEQKTAKSFMRRWKWNRVSIIQAFYHAILMNHKKPTEEEITKVSLHYVKTVNSNIEAFLKDKPHKMTVWLENIESDFRNFWDAIGAEGDYEKAIACWDKKYNASSERNRLREITNFIKHLVLPSQ
ncbi:MAG TPA: hypothetical protein VJ917_00485 [Saprospiraceae bacterium]|nr:hypothetical protein [Saprospiraceae bacterium]